MNNPHPNSKYRADIDGLRALAILPVVIFHAFPNLLPGGFVGVDIFFVISGYLISSIIFTKLTEQRFSFIDFYARRARRLFPALSLVLAASLIFGWFSLDAEEFKVLGKHVAAGAGFIQNFILWGEVGYFDVSSELKPLLHLWSLAIEEQYYLAFPLVIWLALRAGFNLTYVVLAIATASLFANLLWVRSDPTGTFYFPHTRIWELMAGAILASITLSAKAVAGQSDIPNAPSKRWILSCIGISLILVSTLAFDKGHHFPGWRAMIPVLGAVLIIHAGQDSWLNRHVLSSKGLVFIGLISYPLYLWHWPLLSFARIIESEPLSASLRMALVGISFILATLTYLLVEKPVRSGRLARFWTIFFVTLMFAIGTLGFKAHQRELTSRLGISVEEVKDWEQRHPGFEENCAESFQGWNNRKDIYSFKCVYLKKGKPEITVIGDSHARRIFMGLAHHLGDDHNIGLFPMGCAMPFYDISVSIPGVFRTEDYRYPRTNLINAALDFSINDPAVKLIVLTTSACWSNIVDVKNLKDKNAARIVENKMRLTFQKLSQSGKQVLYVLDNPLLNFDPKSCVSRPFRINSISKQDACKMEREVFDKQRVKYFEIARRVLAEFPSIKVFDVASKLCDDEFCYASIDNKLLYHDASHLSFEGCKYVGQFMAPLIKEQLNEPK